MWFQSIRTKLVKLQKYVRGRFGWSRRCTSTMPDIPEDVLYKIFMHLPPKTTRCISKSVQKMYNSVNTRLVIKRPHDDKTTSLIQNNPLLNVLSISGITAQQMTDMIRSLTCQLPSSLQKLSLSSFPSKHNGVDLKTLQGLLDSLPALTDLELQCLPSLTQTQPRQIPFDQLLNLTDLKELKSLKLRTSTDYGIRYYDDDTPCGFASHVYSLFKLTGLHKLDLSDVKIDKDLAVCLSVCLRDMTSLTTLSLENCGLKSSSCISKGLIHLTGLQHLDLSYNEWMGMQPLQPALAAMTCLQDLKLAGCDESIVDLPCEMTSLTRLVLRGCKCYYYEGDDRPVQLATAFGAMTSLQYLDISDMGLHGEHTRSVLRSLKNLVSLTALHIRNNNLCTSGVVAMLPALKKLTKLQELGLSHNDLIAFDIRLLAEVVSRYMPDLRFFDNFEDGRCPRLSSSPAALAKLGFRALPPGCEFDL